MHPR